MSAKSHSKFVVSLLRETHFSRDEVETLLIIYNQLIGKSDSDKLNPNKFKEVLHSTFTMTDDLMMERIYQGFATHGETAITSADFVCGMSIFLKGTLEEHTQFCFKVYDLNGDGYISKEEMYHLLKNSLVKHAPDEDAEEGVKDLIELVCKKLDMDHDGRISYDDFSKSVAKDPLVLQILGQCLPSIELREIFLSTFSVK